MADAQLDQVVLKLCPYCGEYVQGRTMMMHGRRGGMNALRAAMTRHILDDHGEVRWLRRTMAPQEEM